GGASGWNWDPLFSTHGVTLPQPGATIGPLPSTGTQTPGRPAPGAVYGKLARAAPSTARKSTMALAAATPTAVPGSASVRPHCATEAGAWLTKVRAAPPNSRVSARCAAAIAAAAGDAPAGAALAVR